MLATYYVLVIMASGNTYVPEQHQTLSDCAALVQTLEAANVLGATYQCIPEE